MKNSVFDGIAARRTIPTPEKSAVRPSSNNPSRTETHHSLRCLDTVGTLSCYDVATPSCARREHRWETQKLRIVPPKVLQRRLHLSYYTAHLLHTEQTIVGKPSLGISLSAVSSCVHGHEPDDRGGKDSSTGLRVMYKKGETASAVIATNTILKHYDVSCASAVHSN